MYSSKAGEELRDNRQELSWEDLEPCLIREHDEFTRYFRRWIKYHPRKPYHVKKGYDWGFIQQKTKKGNPAALHGEWLISCVERHLANYLWAEQQIHVKRQQTEDRLIAGGMNERLAKEKAWQWHPIDCEFIKDWPYWLALHRPKMTTDHCIDLDAKRYEVARYQHKGIIEPVVCPDLEHFVTLKRIYDRFPRRIWCISSLTLGIHAWKKHRLRLTKDVHAETKLRLEELGLGSVEVHPMSGRCIRRPFGRDYLVVTPDGILTMWQDQVNYYEDDARSAPFDQIVEAMLGRIDHSILRWHCADKTLGKFQRSVADKRLDDIRRWRDNGFKERLTVPRSSSPPGAAAEPITPGGGDRVDWGKVDLGDLTIPTTDRSGRWPIWVERMAITGLVADDTVGHVVHEMAKWLYWIELFDLPVVERADKIETLLGRFVLTKHNGFVTRLNDGKERDVLAQVRSALRSASQIDRLESLELFARLRTYRSQGKYERLVNLVPILNGCNQGETTSSVFSSLTTYMFINKETTQPSQIEGYGRANNSPSSSSSLTTYMFINKELPPSIESEIEQIANDHRMRKRNGQYPLVRFARRLLNTLWQREGTARLSNEALVKMVGTSNPNQEVSYRRLLQQSGLIQEGDGESDYLWQTWELLDGSFSETPNYDVPQKQRSGYQPRVFSKTYRLSLRAKQAFEGYYPQAPSTALSTT